MKKHELRLALIDGDTYSVSNEAPPSKEHFTFTLHRKNLNFGKLEIGQWWMDHKSIYPTRRRKAGNFNALLSYWWQSCVDHQTNGDPAVCESLLLAYLFPRTRSNGSRRVMLDSVVKAENKKERLAQLALLEKMLATAVDDEKTTLEFSRETGQILGPPGFPLKVRVAYDEFVGELLHPAVKLLQRGNMARAFSVADGIWTAWQKKFGRRSNCKSEKQAIDMVSYEARAAVHRCYAHAWETIANWIGSEQGESLKSFVFHRLWHSDLSWPSNEYSDKRFHLFHGHILGLHPAAGSFIQTTTGKKLLSTWLNVSKPGWEHSENPESAELRRLLNGLLIAVTDYAIRYGDSNFERRSKSLHVTDSRLESADVVSVNA